MPFCRATSLVDPADGATPGFWLQLSSDAPGTWTGEAQTVWPQPVGGIDTLATYATTINAHYLTLCTRLFGPLTKLVARPLFTFSSLSPIVVSNVDVQETTDFLCNGVA